MLLNTLPKKIVSETSTATTTSDPRHSPRQNTNTQQCRPPSLPLPTPLSSSRMTALRSPSVAARLRPSARPLLIASQADKLQTLITAAKIADVEPIWTSLFAKVRCAQEAGILDATVVLT